MVKESGELAPSMVPGDDPDADAVRAVIAGRVAAFGEIVARHHRALLRVLVGIVTDAHLAEDVAQEVWFIVYRRLESFGFRARFKTWLFRVAVREALSAKNRVRRLLSRIDSAPFVDPVAPEVVDDGDRVRRLLGLVPAAERAAFVMHAEGFQYDEIALALACPIGTVATRVHRARQRLLRLVGAPSAPAAPVTPGEAGAEASR